MAVSKALRRLLRIRDLEEEQCRLALESAQGELHRLEAALLATSQRERRGRSMVQSSARSGELPDRLAGLEESRTADRFTAVLTPWIARSEQEVALRRQEFFLKRIERRQAETLIEESEACDAIEDGRRTQQSLDDWYNARLYRSQQEPESGASTADCEPTLEEAPRKNLRENPHKDEDAS